MHTGCMDWTTTLHPGNLYHEYIWIEMQAAQDHSYCPTPATEPSPSAVSAPGGRGKNPFCVGGWNEHIWDCVHTAFVLF